VKRIVVGISGASGAIYGIRFLELLRGMPDVETHLVVSEAARRTIVEETDVSVRAVEALATRRYPNRDIGASLASGSFRTDGMVVVPCSIKTAAAIEAAITPRTKAIFLGYPNNPTGAVLSAEELAAIGEVAVRHDLLVISDGIYDRLVYGEHQHVCFAGLPGMRARTITLGGFSKDYAMTGWRIGYAAAPAAILSELPSVPAAVQRAIISDSRAG